MQIKLNVEHLFLWGRILTMWIVFVASIIILGWRYNPRADEVLFAMALPLFVIPPYVAFCFIVALLRAWIVGRYGRPTPAFGVFPDIRRSTRPIGPDQGLANGVRRVGPDLL